MAGANNSSEPAQPPATPAVPITFRVHSAALKYQSVSEKLHLYAIESLTQQLVASGRYNNVSEVVRDGLRVLESRVQEEAAKLAALRDAAKLGFAAIERGEHLPLKSDQSIENLVKQAGTKAKAMAVSSPARVRRSA